MALKKFRMVTARNLALWRGQELPQGVAKLIIAGESEDDVRWFFSKIDWSAWRLEPVEDEPRGPGRPPKEKDLLKEANG